MRRRTGPERSAKSRRTANERTRWSVAGARFDASFGSVVPSSRASAPWHAPPSRQRLFDERCFLCDQLDRAVTSGGDERVGVDAQQVIERAAEAFDLVE